MLFHAYPGCSVGGGGIGFSDTETSAPIAMAMPMKTETTCRGVRESEMINTLVPGCRLHISR